jgi:hypothetical protein
MPGRSSGLSLLETNSFILLLRDSLSLSLLEKAVRSIPYLRLFGSSEYSPLTRREEEEEEEEEEEQRTRVGGFPISCSADCAVLPMLGDRWIEVVGS